MFRRGIITAPLVENTPNKPIDLWAISQNNERAGLTMELLAPAGDRQSFYAAVYNGADAVYLGLQAFNARRKAANFTTDNLGEIVAFAHLYRVKVYVTINILIKDAEVAALLDTVRACVRAGVDAYIIQDLGMAQLLRDSFPHIVLHASTQMGVHNLSGAQFLAQFGFKRVVLARETKLDDIKLIKKHTNLEIEYFGQGALCVAFSGNCYLSALKNGHSGNRGECLQLCRLPYQVRAGAQTVATGYYLSAQDLCLLGRLPELAAAGVDALKIEGRLKRASYVAQVTRSYRQALDAFDTLDVAAEKAKIRALFARGAFNEQAYLTDNFHIINPQVGHHQGRTIGKVLATTPFKQIYKITLQLNEAIGPGDAIRLVHGAQEFSIGVGNVNVLAHGQVAIFSTQNVPAGAVVFLLKSEAQEKVLRDYVRPLSVAFVFTAAVGQPAQLTARHGDVAVTVTGTQPLPTARTAGLTTAQVAKQLGKLNDTKFRLNDLQCQLGNVFMTVAALNELRRQAIVALETALLAKYQADKPVIRETKPLDPPVIKTPRRNFYLITAAQDLDNADLKGFDLILCPPVYSPAAVQQLVTALTARGINQKSLYLNLPIIATEAEMTILDEILQSQNIGIVANNYAHLRWVKQYRTIAGLGLNVFNNYTARALLQLGCENIIWALEHRQAPSCGSALVSGYPDLMTVCHCPAQAVFGGDCAHCRYQPNLVYQDERHNRYQWRRWQIQHCYFGLFSAEKYQSGTQAGKIYDLRGEK